MDEDLIFKELAYGSSAASKKDVALQALFQSKTDDEQKFPQFIPLQQKKQSNWIDDDIFSPKADSKVEEPAPQKLLPFLQRLPALSSSEIRSLRKDQKIHVDGSSIPTPIRMFEKVFPASLSEIIAANRFETPTPIQMQGIPVLMAKRNLIAVAPTGSGKTAAYLLPIISSIIEMRTQKKTEKELNIHPLRAVIIAPTRELERQILETAAELSRGLNIKVSQPKTKTQSVERTHSSSTTPSSSTSNVLFTIPKGANIAVCSPHSAFQLVRQDNNVFSALDYAIFDEADKLWDDSFKDKAAVILSAVQRSSFVSCGFFSATMSESIMSILKSQLDMPIEMTVGVPSTAAENVIQELKYCGNEEGKFIALRDLLEGGGTPLLPPIAVFVQSKERCEELCAALKEEQRKAVMLHSSLTKRESDYALESIRNGSAWIIVATELMARGMDLRSLNAVINYDFPQSVESYVHRIGRSGRRRTGYAVTFFTEEDFPSLPMIANVIKQSGGHVEEYMLHLKELTADEQRKLVVAPPIRDGIAKITSVRVPQARWERLKADAEKNKMKFKRKKTGTSSKKRAPENLRRGRSVDRKMREKFDKRKDSNLRSDVKSEEDDSDKMQKIKRMNVRSPSSIPSHFSSPRRSSNPKKYKEKTNESLNQRKRMRD